MDGHVSPVAVSTREVLESVRFGVHEDVGHLWLRLSAFLQAPGVSRCEIRFGEGRGDI
jgi:hypothetical protein